MERLRDHMEAAIRERWQENPLAARPVPHEQLSDRRPDELRPVRLPVSPRRARTSTIRKVAVRKAALARNHLVAAQADSPMREAYLGLQAAVLQRVDEEDLRVIGVTSPSKASGKTLTAVNLAISLAIGAGRPAMILDFDFGAPRVHKLFDVEVTAGLEDHLFNGVSLADVLFSPSIDGVAVLPARGGVEAANKLMQSGRLATVLERIKRDHSEKILVLDLPSLGSSSDREAFEALVDGIVLVVEDDVTEVRDYRRALRSFSSEKLIGTVLNRVPS